MDIRRCVDFFPFSRVRAGARHVYETLLMRGWGEERAEVSREKFSPASTYRRFFTGKNVIRRVFDRADTRKLKYAKVQEERKKEDVSRNNVPSIDRKKRDALCRVKVAVKLRGAESKGVGGEVG